MADASGSTAVASAAVDKVVGRPGEEDGIDEKLCETEDDR